MTTAPSPRVSVITGYYNRVNAVEATIKSILNQSFRDLELIAFDDCSTDGTREKLLQLQQELGDPRFKVIAHSRNKGFTQGMIDAIAESSGEYICVQGSGDISLPTRVEKQVRHLDEHPNVGAVGCWYTNVVSTSGIRRPRKPSAEGISFDELIRGNVFSHGEVMMRRSAYTAAGGYRAAFKNCQDYDLWLRMVRLYQLGTVPELLYERYIRFDGVSYDPRKFSVQARYFLLAQRIARMPPHEAEIAVRTLEKEGPLSMIPKSDSALQRRYIKAALRSTALGAKAEAESLALECIVNPVVRTGIVVFIRAFSHKSFTPVRTLISKALGLNG